MRKNRKISFLKYRINASLGTGEEFGKDGDGIALAPQFGFVLVWRETVSHKRGQGGKGAKICKAALGGKKVFFSA